ncbi:hypothetical protein CBR_g55024 [Chara braunii]|uniref:Ty3 transposon capsid-like protein domain-containing protein n=1 Tax=Chara braunii TaxID=69332 RepID=A0A388MCN1_CHABU|nr:hypothetical protein CBR_g55024 [Chara braunii]|eukprot:GBG92255.1 hypothetical protein CBR_g55024 [Chara braunii]
MRRPPKHNGWPTRQPSKRSYSEKPPKQRNSNSVLQAHRSCRMRSNVSATSSRRGLFVPSAARPAPTAAEQEKTELAYLLRHLLHTVNWQQEQLRHHAQAAFQQQQILKAATKDCHTLATAINSAKTQQGQVNDSLTVCLSMVQAQPHAPAAAPTGASAAGQQWGPRIAAIESTAATTTQRIDHIISLIDEVGQFEAPTMLSNQVTTLRTELGQLKSRLDSGKAYKMPKFNVAKFDDYHKIDALAWWTAFNTEADVHHVPNDQRLNALYLQLIGGTQAFMNNLALQKACTITTLHTKIAWEEFEQLWQTRFMIRNVRKTVMNELYRCSQGTMPTRAWLTKWQKFVTTPKFNLDLEDLRSEFSSRSCDGLTKTLGNELQYETFDAVISRANILIQTDRGKKGEDFNNWEANVHSYLNLQGVTPEDHVLVAFQAIRDEATSFARSLARATNCDNDMVTYSRLTPLSEFLKSLRERFSDVTRGLKASDKLQMIHTRQWKSVHALKSAMDELIAVPGHGVTDAQLLNLFCRALPENIQGHFFEKKNQQVMTYVTLSREAVAFAAQASPVTTFWHKDLSKGKMQKGCTILGQIKAKDSLILAMEEGGADEVPYSNIEWGLEEEENSGAGQGRTYIAVAVGGRPQGGGQRSDQNGQAPGGRGQGGQGVRGNGNRQARGRGGSPSNRPRFSRPPPRQGWWHPGRPDGKNASIVLSACSAGT